MKDEELKDKAKELGLYGMLANWDKYGQESWLPTLLLEEESERGRRSMDRRIKDAKLGEFKPMSEFDWSWPRKIDRELVDDLFTLQFINDKSNVVLVSANGLGKSMISQNLAYRVLMDGHDARFVKASDMLDELSIADGAYSRRRCLRKYTQPALLVIDEVGYLSYDNRYADLLYEVVNARYQIRSTIVTTNRPFQEWNEIFPTAACVVTLVDRLVHKAEVVYIEGDSYRKKEAKERAAEKEKNRKAKGKSKTEKNSAQKEGESND